MSLYAIGDVQGCFNALEKLLNHIDFDPDKDELWFTGDLVNRGPQSLETLHYVRQLGDKARCVLGNHDIYLLKVLSGLEDPPSNGCLEPILGDKQRDQLCDWLRHRPLFVFEAKKKLAMVHAGLLPSWDFNTAKMRAEKVEQQLQAKDYKDFLKTLNSKKPDAWHDEMTPSEQLQITVNVMTRIRFCDDKEQLALSCKGSLGQQPAGFKPWFEWPQQRAADITVVTGHWAALGFLQRPGLLAIDTGCVWGQQLTAYRLDADNEKRFSIECQ